MLFNQRRHIVFESHYLGKKVEFGGLQKFSARERPSISGGLHGVLEAPHKYSHCVYTAGIQTELMLPNRWSLRSAAVT